MNEERNLQIDALKGVLIVLVILGHLLEPFIYRLFVVQTAYSFIYLFHMPLFIMLAGIFSKPKLDKPHLEKILIRIILPLVVFQVMYLCFIYLIKSEIPGSIFQPYWILWFLLSLTFWHITMPLVLCLKNPLLSMSAIAVLAGYIEAIGYPLSLSRTIYFAPFFLFGFLYGLKAILWAADHRLATIVVLPVTIFLVVIAADSGIAPVLLYGSKGYALTGPHFIEPGVERILVMFISLITALAFAGFFLRPWKSAAYLGQRSLSLFLLHGFCVIFIDKLGRLLSMSPILMAAMCIPLSLVVAFTLAPLNRFTIALFDWLGERVQMLVSRITQFIVQKNQ